MKDIKPIYEHKCKITSPKVHIHDIDQRTLVRADESGLMSTGAVPPLTVMLDLSSLVLIVKGTLLLNKGDESVDFVPVDTAEKAETVVRKAMHNIHSVVSLIFRIIVDFSSVQLELYACRMIQLSPVIQLVIGVPT
jgi:hypothetical protein